MLARCLSPRALGPFISRQLFPAAHQEELRREFVERFAKNDEQSYRAVFGAIERYDSAGVPEKVRCPVLVVTGDRDYWPVSANKGSVRPGRSYSFLCDGHFERWLHDE